ncbi:glycosyltransferase family 4 protein [uncultured Campylobacter sp.]|jgi:predicted glycosyl transferase|uniref:glycosyltransferase family 4 protein n=1 Tax=uncultured Campylobacter sp. TaxID=218934 RepID=UPI0025FD85F3|nr:glycosyltransferase family 4 protein [uncultured Campylobacter sp.]
MKIFIIGNVASMMINFRKELILKLVEKGHEVFCLVSDYDESSRKEIRRFGAMPIDCRLNAKGVNPIRDILAVIDLIKIIKKHKPNIVFSFFVKPVIFASIAAKIAKAPRIVGMIEGLGGAFTVHKKGQKIKAKFIKNVQILLYKISLPLLDKLIFLNIDDKNELINEHKIKAKNVEILGPIGVDLANFKYSLAPTNPVSFIFVARLLAEKGIFEYLRAAKIIKSTFKDVKFYVLGAFDKENPFGLKKQDIDSYLKDDIVEYIGFVNNVGEWIARSSVFVLPSYREGFPRSTQEAMAIGRAVITTNSVGCKETVIDGVNGFLVPPFDQEYLAQKMQFFIQKPELINKMGKKSRELAERNFDINEINERLIKMVCG